MCCGYIRQDPNKFLWQCPSCKTFNAQRVTRCKQCGAEKPRQDASIKDSSSDTKK